jgi:hypothetical protein
MDTTRTALLIHSDGSVRITRALVASTMNYYREFHTHDIPSDIGRCAVHTTFYRHVATTDRYNIFEEVERT